MNNKINNDNGIISKLTDEQDERHSLLEDMLEKLRGFLNSSIDSLIGQDRLDGMIKYYLQPMTDGVVTGVYHEIMNTKTISIAMTTKKLSIKKKLLDKIEEKIKTDYNEVINGIKVINNKDDVVIEISVGKRNRNDDSE